LVRTCYNSTCVRDRLMTTTRGLHGRRARAGTALLAAVLAVSLAACGSQLDPDTVAKASGSDVSNTGNSTGTGTTTDPGTSTGDPGSDVGTVDDGATSADNSGDPGTTDPGSNSDTGSNTDTGNSPQKGENSSTGDG